MGRNLGAFDNPQELDRPDLNKCPDCLCFFAGDNCPLCGKECPPEMRAGNRKPPKKAKRRRRSSGRVIFMEWYHSWLAIILFTIFMPVVGIILLITSPHQTKYKIIFAAAVVFCVVIIPILIYFLFAIIFGFSWLTILLEQASASLLLLLI